MTKLALFSVLCVAVSLAGCDSVKRNLGLERRTPDEFSVLQRAPLEIPNDLSVLPTPRPGTPRPQDVSANDLAKQAILGEQARPDAVSANAPSVAEAALLNQTGAAAASPAIRSQITREKDEYVDDNRPVVKRLLSVGSDTPPSSVVDAKAEYKRIQDAKKEGRPVTEGETPSIDE